MLRPLKIFATSLLICLAVPCLPQTPNNARPAKGHAVSNSGKITKDESSGTKAGEVAPAVNPQVGPNENKDTEATQDLEVQRQLARFTEYLVWVGILQAVVFALTLLAILQQARIMKEHAGHLNTLSKAAADNAAATLTQVEQMKDQAGHLAAQTKELSRQNRNMLAAERSWIVETIKFLDEIPRRTPSGGGIITALVTFKNIGKQPAFLKILQTRFHTSERLVDSPEFITNEVMPEGNMLAPDQEMYVRVMLEEGSFDDEQVDRINGRIDKRRLNLYLYGCLIYESVGMRGVNRFCYTWQNLMGFSLEGDKARFEKGGPAGYNQHT
jgi:hypothetical protein